MPIAVLFEQSAIEFQKIKLLFKLHTTSLFTILAVRFQME